MERILASKNKKVFDVFASDSSIRNESNEIVNLELPDMGERCDGSGRRRQIHRVPPHLRLKNEKSSQYDPMIVSLGPYHHDKPELRAAEEVKYRFLHRLTSGNERKKNLLYDGVLEKIDEIRGCYADTCVEKYDDEKLAMMMLLDACFIVAFIEDLAGERDIFLDWHQCLGMAALQFAIPDMMLLENQLPFQVIKLIICLQWGKEGEELIQKFLNWLLFADFKPGRGSISLGDDEERPLHLLEACHKMLVEDENCSSTFRVLKQQRPTVSGFGLTKQDGYLMDLTARSVMDLKAKGIQFRPSSSCCVRDVKFKSGAFRAELQLPVRMVWSNSLIALSNLIAYEMSPGAESEFEVLSYTNFMKSLIESPDDVKELQENGILINRFQNSEQLVEEFKGVNTFGLDNFDIFKDDKLEIEEHCRSKAKTWMADLIHTRFRSPWTVTGLLAATFLLCLTFLQTYFTIHP